MVVSTVDPSGSSNETRSIIPSVSLAAAETSTVPLTVSPAAGRPTETSGHSLPLGPTISSMGVAWRYVA